MNESRLTKLIQLTKPLAILKPWAMAARPKTLTTALIPMVLGTVLAKSRMGGVDWGLMWFAILTAFCIQIGTNLINDALDFKKGADTTSRIGPKRVTQSGLLTINQVHTAGLIFFALAFLFAIPLILKGGIIIFWIIAASALCGYLYTGGPFPLAYYGLGDAFVVLFYGIIIPLMMFYIQTGFIDSEIIIAGLQTGLLATALIAINNLRDHDGDAKANKKTLAVRYGIYFSRCEITTALIAPFVCNLVWFSYHYALVAALPYLVLPIALCIIDSLWRQDPGPVYNHYLSLAALTHLLFGAALSVGFYFS